MAKTLIRKKKKEKAKIKYPIVQRRKLQFTQISKTHLKMKDYSKTR